MSADRATASNAHDVPVFPLACGSARRRCWLALTTKNTDTHDELQLALFSSNDWSEESRQVRAMPTATSTASPRHPSAAPSTTEGLRPFWSGLRLRLRQDQPARGGSWRTIEPRSPTNRHVSGSARCGASRRPPTCNGSRRYTELCRISFESGDIYSGRGTTACSESGRSSNGVRRRVRAERARANDLEAEPRTVHTKLTVSMIPLPIGVALAARWVPVGDGLTHKLTDLRSWLLNCRSSSVGD